MRSTSTTSSSPLPSTAPGPRGTPTSTTARGKSLTRFVEFGSSTFFLVGQQPALFVASCSNKPGKPKSFLPRIFLRFLISAGVVILALNLSCVWIRDLSWQPSQVADAMRCRPFSVPSCNPFPSAARPRPRRAHIFRSMVPLVAFPCLATPFTLSRVSLIFVIKFSCSISIFTSLAHGTRGISGQGEMSGNEERNRRQL